MNNNFHGSVAVVTGVNSFIGAEIARELYKRKAAVIGTYLPEHEDTGETIAKLRQDMPDKRSFIVRPFDQTNDQEILDLFAYVREHFVALHILVTVASCQYPERFLDQSFAQIDRQVNVNLNSTIKLVHAAVRCMIENLERQEADTKPLSIGVMGSVRGSIPVKADAYEFAKAGLHHMVRGLASEIGQYGISINAIAPGTVDCPLEHERYGNEPAYRTAWESVTPLKRPYKTSSLVTPSDVASAMLFALDHPSMTGQIFDISGGYKHMPLLPIKPEA
jgi:3-oxoacyl-[acyl-carrier protein] reductase